MTVASQFFIKFDSIFWCLAVTCKLKAHAATERVPVSVSREQLAGFSTLLVYNMKTKTDILMVFNFAIAAHTRVAPLTCYEKQRLEH